jgi:hypothetical protein
MPVNTPGIVPEDYPTTPGINYSYKSSSLSAYPQTPGGLPQTPGGPLTMHSDDGGNRGSSSSIGASQLNTGDQVKVIKGDNSGTYGVLVGVKNDDAIVNSNGSVFVVTLQSIQKA